MDSLPSLEDYVLCGEARYSFGRVLKNGGGEEEEEGFICSQIVHQRIYMDQGKKNVANAASQHLCAESSVSLTTHADV